jgi:DNA-binding transcriptional ArsR family regulator
LKNCDVNCQCTIFHQDALLRTQNHMKSEDDYTSMIEFYSIFSDSTRVKILDAIAVEKHCVCDLAYLIDVSKSAISHQMKKLKKLNLVSSEKKGKMVYYFIEDSITKAMISLAWQHIKDKNHD